MALAARAKRGRDRVVNLILGWTGLDCKERDEE